MALNLESNYMHIGFGVWRKKLNIENVEVRRLARKFEVNITFFRSYVTRKNYQ